MLERIIEFDHQVTLAINGSNSLFLDGVATAATATITWIPLALVLVYVIVRNNNLRNMLLTFVAVALCVAIADQVASGICKPLFERFRPAQDPSLIHLVDIVNGYRGGRFGFFSSHAANTFSLAMFVSLLIRNKALTLGLFSWAILNCWTRLYLGVHFMGDILVGIFFGSFVGAVVYFLFCKVSKVEIDTTHRSEIQTSSGYPLEQVYMLLSALLLTYIYILFRGAWL